MPLFTEVRGRIILGSSLAGSCIDAPPEPRGWPERASTPETGALHLVVLDNDAGRRIGPVRRTTMSASYVLTPRERAQTHIRKGRRGGWGESGGPYLVLSIYPTIVLTVMVFTIPLLRAVPPSSSSSSRPSAASSRTSATYSGERRHLPDPDRVREVGAEEAGQAAEGELAHPFRSFGNLSMGVAPVLMTPRIWAPAPAARPRRPRQPERALIRITQRRGSPLRGAGHRSKGRMHPWRRASTPSTRPRGSSSARPGEWELEGVPMNVVGRHP
jgi:hypothetical protein